MQSCAQIGAELAKESKTKSGQATSEQYISKSGQATSEQYISKTGQATSEQYISKCIIWDRLHFYNPFCLQQKADIVLALLRVICLQKADIYSIDSTESDLECSISILENELPPKKTTLKKSIAERKLELLSKCIESMTQPPSEEESTKMPYFALFIGEKWSRLSK